MSKRKTQGAGHVPAPAGPVDQAQEVIVQLRAEVREARGALGDLLRERKAVEQLARDRAEKAIESHVNACIEELVQFVNSELKNQSTGIVQYFQAMLDHYINPQRHGRPEEPALPQLLEAVDIVSRAMAAGRMAMPEGSEKGEPWISSKP